MIAPPNKITGLGQIIPTINRMIECLWSLMPATGPNVLTNHTTKGVTRVAKPQGDTSPQTCCTPRWG